MLDPSTGAPAQQGSRKPSEQACGLCARVLGGSWVVISGVIGKVAIIITNIRGLVTHS